MGSFPLFGPKWTSFRAEGFSRLRLPLRSLQFLVWTINGRNRASSETNIGIHGRDNRGNSEAQG